MEIDIWFAIITHRDCQEYICYLKTHVRDKSYTSLIYLATPIVLLKINRMVKTERRMKSYAQQVNFKYPIRIISLSDFLPLDIEKKGSSWWLMQ